MTEVTPTKTELDVCIDRITRSHRKADLTEMKYWAYKLIEEINKPKETR